MVHLPVPVCVWIQHKIISLATLPVKILGTDKTVYFFFPQAKLLRKTDYFHILKSVSSLSSGVGSSYNPRGESPACASHCPSPTPNSRFPELSPCVAISLSSSQLHCFGCIPICIIILSSLSKKNKIPPNHSGFNQRSYLLVPLLRQTRSYQIVSPRLYSSLGRTRGAEFHSSKQCPNQFHNGLQSLFHERHYGQRMEFYSTNGYCYRQKKVKFCLACSPWAPRFMLIRDFNF